MDVLRQKIKNHWASGVHRRPPIRPTKTNCNEKKLVRLGASLVRLSIDFRKTSRGDRTPPISMKSGKCFCQYRGEILGLNADAIRQMGSCSLAKNFPNTLIMQDNIKSFKTIKISSCWSILENIQPDGINAILPRSFILQRSFFLGLIRIVQQKENHEKREVSHLT